MIQAAYLSLEVWREGGFSNDDWQFVDPTQSPPAPIDLTGFVLNFLVAQQEALLSTAPLISITSTATTGDRIIVTDLANGKFHPSIAAATLAALPLAPSGDPNNPGTLLFCALLATPLNGVEEVYAAGPFVVRG